MVTALAIGFLIAAVIFAVGIWGYRSADSLAITPGWDPGRINRRRRVLRRGAVTCMVTGLLLLMLTVSAVAHYVAHPPFSQDVRNGAVNGSWYEHPAESADRLPRR